MRLLILLLLTCLYLTVSSQHFTDDKHKEFPKKVKSPGKSVKEVQYYKISPLKQKNAIKYGRLVKFTRFNESGEILEYHIYKRIIPFSEKYKYIYGSNESIEIHKINNKGKVAYRWMYTGDVINEEVKYNRKGNIIYKWQYIYNGDLLKSLVKYGSENDTVYYQVYNYNSLDYLENMTKYQDGKQILTWSFHYDKNGNRTGAELLDKEGNLKEKYIIEYSSDNKFISKKKTDPNGVTKFIKSKEYNAAGKVTYVKECQSENKCTKEIQYKYDTEGNNIEEKHLNNGNIKSIIINDYKNGKLVSAKIYSSEKDLQNSIKYKLIKVYKYDKRSNLIETNIQTKKGAVKQINRQIYYYFN